MKTLQVLCRYNCKKMMFFRSVSLQGLYVYMFEKSCLCMFKKWAVVRFVYGPIILDLASKKWVGKTSKRNVFLNATLFDFLIITFSIDFLY
jgi:hypothetical protein